MNSKIVKNNTKLKFMAVYLVKVVIVYVLCYIHDFTRFKICRNFKDLFYWPEGLCIDTFVVFGVFILGIWVIYDCYVFLKSSKKW